MLILFYQLSYFLFPIKNYLPSIKELIISIFQNFSKKDIYIHIYFSLFRVIIGFFIASFFGILTGLILGINKHLSNLKNLIELLRPIPPIAWIPISIMLFGLGNSSAYFIVFIGSFFPIFTNTYLGVSSFPIIYKNISLSFEVNKLDFFLKMVLMYSMPYIFAGLKIGIGMAWMSVIAAELIGAQSGLGYFIQLNRLLLQSDNVIIGMILIGIIGFLLNYLISFFEKKVIRW